MSWRVIPQVCPRCGMPDMREIERHGPDTRYGRVYYVDYGCTDCGYVDEDMQGGV